MATPTRTRTRHRGRPQGSEPQTAPPGELSSAASDYAIEFDARTVHDFVVSLSLEKTEEMDIASEDRRWLLAAREALPAERRRDLEATFSEEGWVAGDGIGALLVAAPEARTARQFVAAISVMDTRDMIRGMLGEVRRDPEAAAQLERILDGADDEIAAFSERAGEHSCGGTETFLRAPAAAIDRLRGLLGAWLPAYEAIEERIGRIIERDLELRRADIRDLPQAELVERTTGGVRWTGEPGVTRLILSPSYFHRPYNFLFGGLDWRLFIYPVADDALDIVDPLAPPPAMVRMHRALGDESRLRIMRLLRDRDMYLTELAQALEVSKPTMKHHLTQLRVAGLVTVTDQGAQTYYSLRRDRVSEAGDDLMRYLA